MQPRRMTLEGPTGVSEPSSSRTVPTNVYSELLGFSYSMLPRRELTRSRCLSNGTTLPPWGRTPQMSAVVFRATRRFRFVSPSRLDVSVKQRPSSSDVASTTTSAGTSSRSRTSMMSPARTLRHRSVETAPSRTTVALRAFMRASAWWRFRSSMPCLIMEMMNTTVSGMTVVYGLVGDKLVPTCSAEMMRK